MYLLCSLVSAPSWTMYKKNFNFLILSSVTQSLLYIFTVLPFCTLFWMISFDLSYSLIFLFICFSSDKNSSILFSVIKMFILRYYSNLFFKSAIALYVVSYYFQVFLKNTLRIAVLYFLIILYLKYLWASFCLIFLIVFSQSALFSCIPPRLLFFLQKLFVGII